MANQTSSKLHVIDTAAGSKISGQAWIRLIQWIDDAEDIADSDDLAFKFNGITVTIKYQKTTDVGSAGVVYYQAGPFNPGFMVEDFEVTVIDAGNLLVFID